MILAGFFQTVEFFVIAALSAAAIVAYMCMPKSRGEAVVHTVAGELSAGDGGDGEESELLVEVRDDGAVVLTRSGIEGITASGAVSVAATVCGFDMNVEERRMRGFSNDARLTKPALCLTSWPPSGTMCVMPTAIPANSARSGCM